MAGQTIRRKKNPSVEAVFYENNHGVLDGDPSAPGLYLTTRWSCREDNAPTALDSTCAILVAKTVEEGQAALGRVSNSAWNWVFADRSGNIGYQMSGKMPIRRSGISGMAPLPGWDQANDWQGFYAPEDLPRALNPPQGFLATANQDLNQLGKVHPINLCMASYRADRISAIIGAPNNGKMTLKDMRAIQLDLYSPQAEFFMAIIRPLLPEFASAHPEALRLLQEWDFNYTSESKAAFVFEQIYRALICQVFGECECSFGAPVLERILNETCLFFDFYGNFDRVLLAEKSAWFGKQSRANIYRTAMAKALATPPQPYGSTRKVRMRHLLFGGKFPLFLGFDCMLEMPGNRATATKSKRPWPAAPATVVFQSGIPMACATGSRDDTRGSMVAVNKPSFVEGAVSSQDLFHDFSRRCRANATGLEFLARVFDSADQLCPPLLPESPLEDRHEAFLFLRRKRISFFEYLSKRFHHSSPVARTNKSLSWPSISQINNSAYFIDLASVEKHEIIRS